MDNAFGEILYPLRAVSLARAHGTAQERRGAGLRVPEGCFLQPLASVVTKVTLTVPENLGL